MGTISDWYKIILSRRTSVCLVEFTRQARDLAFLHGRIHILLLCIPVRFYMHLLIGMIYIIKVLVSCPSGGFLSEVSRGLKKG